MRSPNVDGDCLAAHPRGAVVDLVGERNFAALEYWKVSAVVWDLEFRLQLLG